MIVYNIIIFIAALLISFAFMMYFPKFINYLNNKWK